jgi:hypothetical protein
MDRFNGRVRAALTDAVHRYRTMCQKIRMMRTRDKLARGRSAEEAIAFEEKGMAMMHLNRSFVCWKIQRMGRVISAVSSHGKVRAERQPP